MGVPETNVGNIGWQEGRSPCHAQERGKSGLCGFLGRASRVTARQRSSGLLVALAGESFI